MTTYIGVRPQRSPVARQIYRRRLAIVEPVFANLRSNKQLNRFTYRGGVKVNIQWLLYCLVHNLEKIAHRGNKYGGKKPGRGLLGRWSDLQALLRAPETLLSYFWPLRPLSH